MSIIKYSVLGALGLAALATDPGTAEASMTNKTTAWCKTKGAADQVIVDGAFASLIWKADGDLVLQPLNHLVNKIWSSGTAGAGDKVCWETNGTLAVHSAAGTVLWSRSGGSVPAPGGWNTGDYDYKITPSLSSCDLSARYTVYETIPAMPPLTTTSIKLTLSKGTLWTRAATCPVVSQSVVADDWCLELPPAGQERPIVQSMWSELVWMPGGFLVHRGTGISAGEEIWKTSTAGQGKELCFEPTGRVAIYDALGQPLWSTGAGTTTTSHLLELDDCDLAVKPVDGSSPSLWTSSRRCPQATAMRNTHATVGATDTVLLENDLARLVFQSDGNLVLRSSAGDEVWHSALAAGRGKRVAFQTDGNLVIYDAANNPAWGAKMWDGTVTEMVLDGCAVKLLAGSTVKWTRGFATCPGGTLTNSPAWSFSSSGVLTVLRAPESRLVWQGDGNLVLYTAGGAPVWASNTNGIGKQLSFQADGNLVIYGTSAAVWSSDTWISGTPTYALNLGDHCTLTLAEGSATKWTGSNSCTVVNHSFESAQGDSMFGASLHTHLTAKDNGTARLDSTTGIDLTIFGQRIELFSGSGYQTETDTGADGGNATLAIFGESAVSVNITYEQTFFEYSRTFNVGPVPVVVSAGATGELGLSLAFAGGTLTLTPKAGIYATVSAGVGGECDVGGASAGIRGNLTLIELTLPISLKLYLENGQPRFTIKGDLTISTLSGSFELYAEAYVKICFVKVSADWSYELFSWTGFEWTKNLFSKSGGF